MMSRAAIKPLVVFVLDLLVVLFAIGCLVFGLVLRGEGVSFFFWYTRLSNLLAAVACTLALPCDLTALRSARDLAVSAPGHVTTKSAETIGMPQWLRALKLAGLATVMVTFLTVFLFLGFAVGHLKLLQNTNFFFHLVSPLLVLASCIVERSSFNLPRRTVLLPVILTVAYAVWYLVEVVVIGESAGGWRDFYGFNTGGMWPVSMVTMIALSVLVSFVCWKLTGGKGLQRKK